MSADAPREFVDANILVYAFDASAGDKKARAERLLARLWESGTGTLSVQILQEFFVVVTGKVPRPLAPQEAADPMREVTARPVFRPRAHRVLAGIPPQKDTRLSFWDAMVVHA